MKTFVAKKEEITQDWLLVDAADKVVGRLATKIARILQGKHKPVFTPHIDTGDFVVVVNSEKVRFTGKKWDEKEYDRYSGYPGGRVVHTAQRLHEKKPTEILKLAVRRMLPKTKLGVQMFSKLKVYAGSDHPHQAQQLKKLDL